MLKIFIFILINFMWSVSHGQGYKIVAEIPTADTIKPDDDINRVFFKIYKDTIYQLKAINKNKTTCDLKVSSFDIVSGAQLKCDTILGFPLSFSVQDLVIHNGYILIAGNEQLIYFDRRNMLNTPFLYPENLEYKNDIHPFKYCEILNDTLLLLYTIYNYHPNDGMAGVYLKTLNTKTKKFDRYHFLPFPGVGITHLSGNWLTVVKDRIYIVTPLGGEIYTLNFNFDLLSKGTIPVFDPNELENNTVYQTTIDSVIVNETKRIQSITKKYPKDSVKYHREEYASMVYTKTFIGNTIKEVREHHAFVSSITTADDSLIVIVVTKPEYGIKFKDVQFYDPNKHKIVRKIKKAVSAAQDSITCPEDIFSINFSDSKPRLPYFHKAFAYYPSLYSRAMYQPGKYEDVSLKLFNATKIKGFNWTMYKYRLE